MILSNKIIAILARHKEATKRRLLAVQGQKVPSEMVLSEDPAEALRIGIQMGRREGYGLGLLDGIQLGLDVEESLESTVKEADFPMTIGNA